MTHSACTAMRPLELTMQYTFALLTRKSDSILEMGNYFMLYKIFGEREGNESVATDATLVSNNIQATVVQTLRFFLRFTSHVYEECFAEFHNLNQCQWEILDFFELSNQNL